MFGLWRRRVMTDNERRFHQNSRILMEYPWLWGVRQAWRLRYDNIKIQAADEALRIFLYDPQPDPEIEVWAFRAGLADQLIVERIEPRDYMSHYLERMRDYGIDRLQPLLSLALLQDKGEGKARPHEMHHVDVCIYRPQKGEPTLQGFIDTPLARVMHPSS